MKSLILLLKKYPYTILIEIVNIIIGVVMTIIPINTVREVIKIYEDTKSIKDVVLIILFYGLLWILCNLALVVTNYYKNYIERNFKVYISKLFYKKLDSIDYDFHESPKFLNDYTRALEHGPDRIYESANGIINVIKIVFQSISIFSIIFSMHYIAVVYAIGIGIIYALIRFRVGKLDFISLSKQRLFIRQRGYVNRTFFIKDSMADLKTSSIEGILLENNAKANESILGVIDTIGLRKTILTYIGDILITSIYPITLAVLAYVTIDDISFSDFSALTVAATTLSTLVSQLVISIGDLQNSQVECKIPYEVLAMTSSIEGIEYEPLDTEFESLELKDVCFSYADKPILKNINLKINKGEKIAIVGSNGAGKTTLVKLLLRLYDTDSGSILINGKDYKGLNAKSIRKQVGAVFQNVEVYAGSIAENIIFRKPETDEDYQILYQALKFSGLDKIVCDLKDGIYTLVTKEFDKEGVVLSGGQKQRLAIARGVAQNYNLFILDEPSSALDPLSEAVIYQNMLEMGKDKTLIFISHRLTTTVNADKIFLFENGEIIEAGTHEELMAKNGVYKKMFNSQASKYLGGDYENN